MSELPIIFWDEIIEARGDAAVFGDLQQLIREATEALTARHGITGASEVSVNEALEALATAERAELEYAGRREIDRRAGT